MVVVNICKHFSDFLIFLTEYIAQGMFTIVMNSSLKNFTSLYYTTCFKNYLRSKEKLLEHVEIKWQLT